MFDAPAGSTSDIGAISPGCRRHRGDEGQDERHPEAAGEHKLEAHGGRSQRKGSVTVDWLLRHFRRARRDRAPLVCYLRENGPIGYATPLFDADPRGRAEAMLATGLAWYWKTSSPTPMAREWTELSRWSLAALLADLSAERDGLLPHVLAVAIDPQESAAEVTDARVAAWVRAFNNAAAGPLHAVVSRPAPGGDLLFVAQQPPESIRALLQGWGIDRDKAVRRAYARLQGGSLEDVVRSLR